MYARVGVAESVFLFFLEQVMMLKEFSTLSRIAYNYDLDPSSVLKEVETHNFCYFSFGIIYT